MAVVCIDNNTSDEYEDDEDDLKGFEGLRDLRVVGRNSRFSVNNNQPQHA